MPTLCIHFFIYSTITYFMSTITQGPWGEIKALGKKEGSFLLLTKLFLTVLTLSVGVTLHPYWPGLIWDCTSHPGALSSQLSLHSPKCPNLDSKLHVGWPTCKIHLNACFGKISIWMRISNPQHHYWGAEIGKCCIYKVYEGRSSTGIIDWTSKETIQSKDEVW